MVFGRDMKTRIHINQHKIRANLKHGTRDAVITVKDYKNNRYCHSADIVDKDGEVVATIIYSPDKPLGCGARVWIETTNEVITHDSQLEQDS